MNICMALCLLAVCDPPKSLNATAKLKLLLMMKVLDMELYVLFLSFCRYEWVGWRNDTQDFHGPLIITFKFDQVRNFSKVIIQCNNMFSKDVRVFKMALVYFSVGGNLFQNQPVKYDFILDNVVEYARPVMIKLKHNIGKYVRLQLYFDAKWMMISEVQFESGK